MGRSLTGNTQISIHTPTWGATAKVSFFSNENALFLDNITNYQQTKQINYFYFYKYITIFRCETSKEFMFIYLSHQLYIINIPSAS